MLMSKNVNNDVSKDSPICKLKFVVKTASVVISQVVVVLQRTSSWE